MAYAIETVGLTKDYPKHRGYSELLLHPFRKKSGAALKDVSLQLRHGELFCLLGSNGAGKTTLIKILCSLVLPTSGKAFVDGFDVVRQGREVHRKIGYVVSDERSFYWRLTGRQVAELVNKSMNAGVHRVDWNAANVSSGTYFIRMEAENFQAREKCLLIK